MLHPKHALYVYHTTPQIKQQLPKKRKPLQRLLRLLKLLRAHIPLVRVRIVLLTATQNNTKHRNKKENERSTHAHTLLAHQAPLLPTTPTQKNAGIRLLHNTSIRTCQATLTKQQNKKKTTTNNKSIFKD
jgi:hypothetical protein